MMCYNHALEIDPTLALSWLQKGAVFWNFGKFQNALYCFTKTLEIEPDNQQAQQAIAIYQQFLR